MHPGIAGMSHYAWPEIYFCLMLSLIGSLHPSVFPCPTPLYLSLDLGTSCMLGRYSYGQILKLLPLPLFFSLLLPLLLFLLIFLLSFVVLGIKARGPHTLASTPPTVACPACSPLTGQVTIDSLAYTRRVPMYQLVCSAPSALPPRNPLVPSAQQKAPRVC